MGHAASVNSEVTRQDAKRLAQEFWDEALWSKVAATKKSISFDTWVVAAREAEKKSFESQYSQYTKIKRIGKGSFGVVDIAKDANRQLCVTKLVTMKKKRRLAWSEVEQLNGLRGMQHPNILELRKAFCYCNSESHNATMVVVNEYAGYGDLKQRIKIAHQRKRYFKQSCVMDWFVQIAHALRYLHEQHIIHRNLKPQNIFFVESRFRVCKIADLCAAKRVERTQQELMTTTGTPFYMCPEVASNKAYTQKSDIWALGCILSESCSTTVPFAANDFKLLADKITSSEPDPIPDQFSPDVSRIILWLLSKDHTRRPLMRELFNDEFFVDCVRGCRQRLQDSLIEDRREGVPESSHIQKVRTDLVVLTRRRQKCKILLARKKSHVQPGAPRQQSKAEARSLKERLAETDIAIFLKEKQLSNAAASVLKNTIGCLDKTLQHAFRGIQPTTEYQPTQVNVFDQMDANCGVVGPHDRPKRTAHVRDFCSTTSDQKVRNRPRVAD